MLQDLLYSLSAGFLRGNEVLNRRTHPIHHVIRQEILLQHFLTHQIIADGRAHSCGDPSLLLGYDAESGREPPSHDVFRRVRAEQHADGYVVGDVADDATNQWGENIG